VEFPERFIANMQAVSSLRHHNIVALCDFGVSDGLCFIAMEVVHAGSVRALLRRRPPADPLPLPLATDLICQAAEGLAYAHERGVIHKDIRPSNLLLDDADDAEESPDGADETYTLKITDFGLAQLAGGGSEETSSGVTLGSGIMLGAPAYMSPEQCRGGELDGRSDLYSLGVVLYEMLTGMLPFPGARIEDTTRERLFTPPPLPRLLNPEIPPSLEYAMLRCLAKQAGDRFETAADLTRAIRAAVSAV
jgi:serine/threonine-protein kinase